MKLSVGLPDFSSKKLLGLLFFPIVYLSLFASTIFAQDFNIPPSDSNALVTAINSANSNGETDTINLGTSSTYVLTALVSNPAFDAEHGPNGLPLVISEIQINGNGSTIRRDSSSRFRI